MLASHQKCNTQICGFSGIDSPALLQWKALSDNIVRGFRFLMTLIKMLASEIRRKKAHEYRLN